MINGISEDDINKMDEDEVIELSIFIEKIEEIRAKRMAIEMSKAMWGGK